MSGIRRPEADFAEPKRTPDVLSLQLTMKTTQVQIRWPQGLHLRPASQIVAVARRFRSQVNLRFGSQVASATSVLNLIILCATLNATIEIETRGDDEQAALDAVARCFDAPEATFP